MGAVRADLLLVRATEGRFQVAQRNPVLRTAGTGHARHDVAQIELQDVVELRVGRFVGAEKRLLFRVALDQIDQRFRTPVTRK